MIKQDLAEANETVSKRLQYIQAEVKRITNKLTELEGKTKEQQQLVSGGVLCALFLPAGVCQSGC